MYVGNSGILSVVVCCPCSCLCRGLEFLLKVRYITLVDPLWARFLIFETVFLGRMAILPYVWKLYHKNWCYLRLVSHIFNKLSQNVCLINTYTLIYRHAKCDCKLLSVLWFYCGFLGIYMLYYWPFMSELLCLHQTFDDCVSNHYEYKNWSASQMWLQVIDSSLILLYFRYFSDNWKLYSCLKWCISIKLSQVVFRINRPMTICQYARYDCKLR